MTKQLLALVLAIALLLLLAAWQKSSIEIAEPIINRLCAPQNTYIEDFETNEYKLWLEEQTGYKIEMTWLPEKEAGELSEYNIKALMTSADGHIY